MEQETPENLPIDREKPQTPSAYINGKKVPRAPRAKGANRTRTNDDIYWLLVLSAGELGMKGQGGKDGRMFDPAGSRNPSDNWKVLERLEQQTPAVRRWRRLHNVWVALPDQHRWVLGQRYQDRTRIHDDIRGLKAAFEDLGPLVWAQAGLPFAANSAPFLRRTVIAARLTRKTVEVEVNGEKRKARRRRPELTKDEARRKWDMIGEVEAETVSLDEYAKRYPADAPLLTGEATRLMLKDRLSHYKSDTYKPRKLRDQLIEGFRVRAEKANRAAHLAWLDIERDQAMDEKLPRR